MRRRTHLMNHPISALGEEHAHNIKASLCLSKNSLSYRPQTRKRDFVWSVTSQNLIPQVFSLRYISMPSNPGKPLQIGLISILASYLVHFVALCTMDDARKGIVCNRCKGIPLVAHIRCIRKGLAAYKSQDLIAHVVRNSIVCKYCETSGIQDPTLRSRIGWNQLSNQAHSWSKQCMDELFTECAASDHDKAPSRRTCAIKVPLLKAFLKFLY